MFEEENRTIFGTIINYLEDDDHFIIAVDNDGDGYQEIISMYAWEVEGFYPINPKSLLNCKIHCNGNQFFDDNGSKWLIEFNTLEILVDILDYLTINNKNEEKTEPC